ncbi:MAG TPA: acetamidase/formamidase family protein [Candidatus Limnocylindria bacterium]|jgi:acetamidase/formamidase|nr:acetamidase/formamidase family protein [Candidatus Limnocylindria bacterium]
MSSLSPTVHVRPEQYHLAWDRSIEPIASVASGDVVEFDANDAGNAQLSASATLDDLKAVDFSRVDQVNGPIAVEGAEPGDTLEIELLDFQPGDWGWTAVFPDFGLLSEDFTEHALRISRLDGHHGELLPGVRIPLAPFCGELGVAPPTEGAHSTIPPDVYGGNMDTRHLTAGTKLFLPVFAPGGRFSLGDGHAAQGDGEVCGTAIETHMRVQLRLTVRKDLHVPAPQFLTAGPLAQSTNTGPYYATDGVGPDLMAAARDATRRMIEYLSRERDLDPVDAYMLCSVAGDLKISEIVDAPNFIVTMYFPLSIFG